MISIYKLWTFYFNHDCVTIFKIQQKSGVIWVQI
jgi:hypothetical protein